MPVIVIVLAPFFILFPAYQVKGELKAAPPSELIEKKISLRYLNPQMAEIQVKEMLSAKGTIKPDNIRKELIITDVPENIEKIALFISQIDKAGNINPESAPREKGRPYLDIVKIKYISSSTVINFTNDVLETETGNSSYSFVKDVKITGLKLTGPVKIKNLAEKNKLLLIANARDNRRIKEIIAIFDKKPKTGIKEKSILSDKFESRVILLRNLSAIEAAQILHTLIQESNKTSARKKEGNPIEGYLSKNNIIVPVPGNNSLIISGNPKNIRELSVFIKELDKPQPQVLIEVTIMEVSLKNGQSIGFEWTSKKQVTTTGTNFGINSQLLGGGQGYFFKYGTQYFDAVVSAIQETTDVKVLSAPHILVTNNKKATISIGDSIVINKEKLEIPTSDVSNPIVRTTHDYIDVGLKLEITPKIGDNGLITLDIVQDVNDIKNSGVPGFPEISKRNLSTTIIAKDRESLVMGGLINRKSSNAVSMIPMIGYIPVLGRLFRKTVNEVKTTELVLFVTAYIVTNSPQLSNLTEEQKNKMTEIRKKFFIKKKNKIAK
jgi:general secretion pathway protein D